ncbi:uncharacterized protein LOC143250316 [Tachypleus tridentatus]|uniref:uncharacterized protein LOC143250316 n=1 Tax=Tachypleus tridentatus TaxID=6853 RepID=UPI003FCF7571
MVSGYVVDKYTNDVDKPGAHLIVIAAPTSQDNYYKSKYDDIINFDINYAKSVIGKDNIVVLGDSAAIEKFKPHLPDDILFEKGMWDIWMRDPTTVNPYNPVQFRLTPASYKKDQTLADNVQDFFTKCFKSLGVTFDETPKAKGLFMDGGNVVDNYADKIVVTERFMQDNALTKDEAKQELKRFYEGVDKVAIVPVDDPNGLAHSDGMVMFINKNIALVTNYTYNSTLRNMVLSELKNAFPGIELIEDADTWTPKDTSKCSEGSAACDSTVPSACGLMVNGVLTEKYLYIPTFKKPTDQSMLNTIQSKATQTVVPIEALGVCEMGGNVRCLSWQLTGENAKKVIQAARNKVYTQYC